MIEVIIGTNTDRSKVIIPVGTTLKQALSDAEIDYSIGQVALDGATVQAGGLNKTFQEYGIEDKCFLVVTVKSDGGAIA